MHHPPDRSAKLRAALRTLGNPYACDQVYEVDRSEEESVHVDDPAVSAYLRRQENPYARFGVTAAEPSEINTSTIVERSFASRMSKEQFRSAARRIFRGYIPATEKGVLRQHHRDFIVRNEERPAGERASLIAHLSRYDLTDLGMQGQFNRERDDVTAAKLAQIEEDALGKSKP